MPAFGINGGIGASPFPPIAEYAFLSDCETCALVAPSGNVEWLCLPRFDSPSVFGAILDRDAGMFRLGPTDVDVPAARRYLPGHDGAGDELGRTERGWIIVRDVAADRALAPRGRALAVRTAARPPTTTPSTCCCARCAACNGEVAGEPRLRAGRSTTAASTARWEYDGGGYHEARRRAATASTSQLRLTTDMRLGFEGPRATARTLMKEGETALRRALVVGARAAPPTYEEAYKRLVWTAHHWQHWLDARRLPRPPVAHLPAAQRAHAQGPDLRADRRARRRGDDVAARDARRRAQLGLPLHVDPRRDVHALGPLHARLRLGGERLLLLPRRRRRGATQRRPPDHVRRSAASSELRRADARPPLRLRGRAAGAHRQRRLRASPSTTSGARSSTRSTCTRSRATSCPSASGRSSSSRSSARSRTGASPTAASGRCAASRSTSPRRR